MTCAPDSARIDSGTAPLLERTSVLGNDRVATGVGLLALHAPRIAASVRPGQFVHLRVNEGGEAILRRPFSVHVVRDERIEILYQIVGRGTLELAAKRPGDVMDALGPLGHGWEVPESVSHALLVAGGLGAAPMGLLAEQLAGRGVAVSVALGAPNAERLVARDLLDRASRRLAVATDDGSEGVHGFVTVLAEQLMVADRPDIVCACGPEVMSRSVAALADAAGVRCLVSLERLMACGIGACLSCVVTTVDGRKRACVDGPVFDAADVVWDDAEVPPRHTGEVRV
ncbi:MAG TPA: dihydroorotate dehydrogenase electron transfer subunit [Coriobacteriia bacterium]